MKLVDAHVHLNEFSENHIKLFSKRFVLIAVSEDLTSSIKNLELSYLYESVIPALGIHPWNAHKTCKEEIEKIIKLVEEKNIKVLGEIGLDKKFYPNTFDKQKEIFERFLKLAKDLDLSLNVHAAGAWREVYDLILKYDIKKVYFHWYTGPIDLLEEIENKGFFIGINPALKIQNKHLEILKIVDVKNILTESDGPYMYRNLYLSPLEIDNLYDTISSVKNLEKEKLVRIIRNNLSKFLL